MPNEMDILARIIAAINDQLELMKLGQQYFEYTFIAKVLEEYKDYLTRKLSNN